MNLIIYSAPSVLDFIAQSENDAPDCIIEFGRASALSLAEGFEPPANFPGIAGISKEMGINELATTFERACAPVIFAPTIPLNPATQIWGLRRAFQSYPQKYLALLHYSEATDYTELWHEADSVQIVWDVSTSISESVTQLTKQLQAEGCLSNGNPFVLYGTPSSNDSSNFESLAEQFPQHIALNA